MAEENVGRRVAEAAVEAAREEFGDHLRSAYVLGSLAHGGFAPLVSDVDVALVLHGPATEADGDTVTTITARIRATGMPLSDRLSMFWGDVPGINGETGIGRFPALDRLDLHRHGHLAWGEPTAHLVEPPAHRDLLAGAAVFAVEILGRPDRVGEIRDPATTAAGGPRKASKVALFPVRFLHTATHPDEIATNETAGRHYLDTTGPGPKADLIRAALGWREKWDDGEPERAEALLGAAAVPLYQEFAAVYATLLADRPDLGARLTTWARDLAR
ncbi:hypothetical protein GCM10009836_18880 [Pseudonocardia ailaonensis]|uniref:Nucleotidyltransferase n=1 Tax=Pseudonocardia ailaonensis TaxID=367279 RepID=A0ABN2MW92_9PSEU